MRANESNTGTLQSLAIEVEQLPAASQFAIFAMRVWFSAMRQKIPLEQALGRLFQDFHCHSGLALFDECMVIAAMSAPKPLTIGCCPSNPNVVADEALMLSCFRALENGSTEKAEKIIACVLMTPMARAFCRPAAQLVQLLNRSELNFMPSQPLSLVKR